jgi:hypothetical protein
MNSERSGKSHATAWVLSILAAPVLYLLSVAPLACSHAHGEGPPWLIRYCFPAKWIADHTVLERPLRAYSSFWEKMMGCGIQWIP